MPSPLPNGTTSIRTLALVGPAAAGKTSLAEALLTRPAPSARRQPRARHHGLRLRPAGEGASSTR